MKIDLKKSFEKLKESGEALNKHLNEISEVIREAENNLYDIHINIPISIEIDKDEECIWFLSWEKSSSKYRLCLVRKHYDNSIDFMKPLIECKKDLRIKYYKKIDLFIQKASEEIKSLL